MINNPGDKTLKHLIVIAIIIALSSFLTACNSNNTSTNIEVVDVHTGTEGLVAEFVKQNPPQTVFIDTTGSQGTQFSSMLTIENKGAANINFGYLNLLIEKDYVQFTDDVQNPMTISLAGKTQDNPYGGQIDKSFSMSAKLDGNSYSKKTQVTALFCYDYETNAVAQVCIDTDVLNQRVGQKACTPTDQTLSSQGAPVAITKIETRMVSKDDTIIPSILIYVQNKGKGQVLNYNPAYIRSACTNEPKNTDTWNVISVEAILGNDQLTCTPAPLHLKNKEDFVKCELPSGIDKTRSAYTSTLQISLRYGYTSTISKEIELKRTN